MAHLSSSFYSPHAGLLEVTLKGTFWTNTSRDAGFPSGNANMLYRAVINGVGMPSIDRYAPSASQTFAYPGGVTWSIYTERLLTAYNGTIGAVGFKDLQLTAVLIKR